jgi:hypothetical protein
MQYAVRSLKKGKLFTTHHLTFLARGPCAVRHGCSLFAALLFVALLYAREIARCYMLVCSLRLGASLSLC